MMYTLTVLGTGSIQAYIFGSNSLRENIGASDLVARATTIWVFDNLSKVCKHNVVNINSNDLTWELSEEHHIEEPAHGLTAEIIYAGGGNTVILFGGEQSKETAKRFVYDWSLQVLDQAPGLEIYAVHIPFDWDNGSLPAALEQGMEELSKLRSRLPGTQALLGLGVTAACSSSGLPANGPHPDSDKQGSLANIANSSVTAKWKAAKPATDRLRNMLNIGNFEWTDNLNIIGDLPGRGDSYVAVVHADGNGMGKRIILLNEVCDFVKMPARPFIRAMRYLSHELNGTAEKALQKTVEVLHDEINSRTLEGEVYYPSVDGKAYFPFRPVVFGGDDVTWVCAGPLALTTAQRYLRELEKGKALPSFQYLLQDCAGIPDAAAKLEEFERKTGKKIPASDTPFACAGVAIVKTHYPFFQAYQVSEELAGSAKKFVHKIREDKLASAIDWHYTTTGLNDTLEQIRAREYTTARGDLLYARPLVLDEDYSWRHWENFLNIWRKFNEEWFDKRNKMMALREALRQGPAAVTHFEKIQKVELPQPSLTPARAGAYSGQPLELYGGWVGLPKQKDEKPTCIYLDIVEVEKHLVELH